MAESAAQLKAEIFNALAHPNRIRIIEFLRNGEQCNCDIYPALGLEQSNLSRHLKILLQSGLLISHKEGLRVLYRVADPKIFELIDDVGDLVKSRLHKRVAVLEET